MSEPDNLEKTMILRPSDLRAKLQKTPRGLLSCLNPEVLDGPGGREVSLSDSAVVLGSAGEGVTLIEAGGVAPRHAKLFPSGDMWGVEDLGGGVMVNGRLAHEAWLKPGDEISLGTLRYRFMTEAQEQESTAPDTVSIDQAGVGATTLSMGAVRPDGLAQANARDPDRTQRRVRNAAGAEPTPPARAPRRRAVPTRRPRRLSGMLSLALIVVGAILAIAVLFKLTG